MGSCVFFEVIHKKDADNCYYLISWSKQAGKAWHGSVTKIQLEIHKKEKDNENQ